MRNFSAAVPIFPHSFHLGHFLLLSLFIPMPQSHRLHEERERERTTNDICLILVHVILDIIFKGESETGDICEKIYC